VPLTLRAASLCKKRVGVTSTPERPVMDRPQGLQLPLVQVQLAVLAQVS
jgi:hypothetical protein